MEGQACAGGSQPDVPHRIKARRNDVLVVAGLVCMDTRLSLDHLRLPSDKFRKEQSR
jgi:hypothetical protein